MGRLAGSMLLALLATGSLHAQDERATADAVLKKHGPRLKKIKGVVAVATGGSATDIRILIRVDSEEAKQAVKKELGPTLGGYKIFVYVKAEVGSTRVEPPPAAPDKKKPPPTKPEPPPPVPEDCDIIRDHMKLKPVTHHYKGRTTKPCQLLHRQRLGGGGGHSFWWTKHRKECPVRTGRLPMPKDADKFVKWVYTQGFQPAQRRSFLGPVNLKGSDKLWFQQVKQDLTDCLPHIREGAKWVRIKDDKAGVGWKWEAPGSKRK